MELIEYSPKTFKHCSFSTSVPAIRFTAAGPIYLNKIAVELLGKDIKKGIILFQDKNRPQDWFFRMSDEGFNLSQYKKEDGTLYFSSKKLVEKVRESIKSPKKAFGLKILDKTVVENIPVYPLLTSTTV